MLLGKNLEELRDQGYCVLKQVYSSEALEPLQHAIDVGLSSTEDPAERLEGQGGVVGGRNLLRLIPATRTCWKVDCLETLLAEVLGDSCGLVRGLYFDKPPSKSWALPWHQDLTIAVHSHAGPSNSFTKPTLKAGVPHVEAPESLLQKMVTLRIHLDPMMDENGPLRVIPSTHHQKSMDRLLEEDARTIHVEAGDVFVMRPLLVHSSLPSHPGTLWHRRILHLEFAAEPRLRDGFAWHDFIPLRGEES